MKNQAGINECRVHQVPKLAFRLGVRAMLLAAIRNIIGGRGASMALMNLAVFYLHVKYSRR